MSNSLIHSAAIVDPKAELAPDVEVGPWTVIGPDVHIDSGSVIGSHVVLKGPTRMGENNRVFQFASVGEDTCDMKYAGEPTELHIGDNNIIREGCTIHRGTVQDKSVTVIGNHNLLMPYVHVAHDCIINNNTILANNTALAGHVEVGDWAILGGYTLVHQFVSIGAHCFSGTGSVILKDVPAYLMVRGNTASPHGLNLEGLRRRGFAKDVIDVLRRAYKIVFRQGYTLNDACSLLEPMAEQYDDVRIFLDSLLASSRGIVR